MRIKKKLVRITTNNQVAIPAAIVRHLRLEKGTYLEVEEKNRKVIMTPKRLVDEDEFAMYEQYVRRGRRELERGEVVAWEDVKKKMSSKKK